MDSGHITGRHLWALLKKTFKAWSDDYAPSMGAALAYYTMFSIAPLLLIVIAIAGGIFGEEAARGQILGELRGLLGTDGARAVEGLLQSVGTPAKSAAAAVFSTLMLLVGATTVFAELQDAFDRIWRAPRAVKISGLWRFFKARLLSFGMIFGIAFLLMASLVFSAALSAMENWWGSYFTGWTLVLEICNGTIGFALSTAMFAMIYKLMPRVSVQWRDVWLGAAVTAVLFSIGKYLIGTYIGKSGITSGFGAAASVVVLLVWVYYSAQIFLLGAEFTWIYANSVGSRQRHGQAEDPATPPRLPVKT